MNRIKKRFLKCVSMLLVITILSQTCFNNMFVSYADISSSSDSVEGHDTATASDAFPMDNALMDGASVYSAGIVYTALQYFWMVILAICGVMVSEPSSIDSISADVTGWGRSNSSGHSDWIKAMENLPEIAWASTFIYTASLVSMTKAYFKAKKGYGSNEGLESVTVSNTNFVTYSDSVCSLLGYSSSDWGLDPSTYIYSTVSREASTTSGSFSDYFVSPEYISDNYKFIAQFDVYVSQPLGSLFVFNTVDNTIFPVSSFTRLDIDYKNSIPIVTVSTVEGNHIRFSSSNQTAFGRFKYGSDMYHYFPFPCIRLSGSSINVNSENTIETWLSRPNYFPTLNNWPIGINGEIWDNVPSMVDIPVISSPVIQQKDIDTVGNLTLPADSDSASLSSGGVLSAKDIEAIKQALAEQVEVIYKESGGDSGLTSEEAYNDLTYVLLSLCSSVGLSDVSTLVVDDFIDGLIDSDDITIPDDLLDEVDEYIRHVKSERIFKEYLKKNGNNNNNNNNNKFYIKVGLLTLFVSFLLSRDSAIDSPVFKDTANINIIEDDSPFPDDKPENPPIDLTELIEMILDLPVKISLEVSKVLNLETMFSNVSSAIELLPDKLVEGFALSSLFDSLLNSINLLPQKISSMFGVQSDYSLMDVLVDIKEEVVSLPSFIKDIVPPIKGTDLEDKNDGGFKKFVIAFISLSLILVLLLIFFLNCLRLIVVIFAIPSSTALLNDDVLLGLNYLKSVYIPLFNLSLYNLIMGAVYFVVIMSIIAVLRKQINHIRIKG